MGDQLREMDNYKASLEDKLNETMNFVSKITDKLK